MSVLECLYDPKWYSFNMQREEGMKVVSSDSNAAG